MDVIVHGTKFFLEGLKNHCFFSSIYLSVIFLERALVLHEIDIARYSDGHTLNQAYDNLDVFAGTWKMNVEKLFK